MSRSCSAAWALALSLSAIGCGKTGADADQPGSTATTGGTSAGGETGGGSSGSGSSSSSGGGLPLMCPDPHPGPSPLGRLRGGELNRTLATLVPEASLSGVGWLPQGANDDLPDTPASAVWVEQLHRLAHDTALRVSADPASVQELTQCGTAEQDEACRDQFLAQFLARAFRRPASEDDLADMSAVFDEGQAQGGDFASGVRAVVEVALQSPEFVYLVEQGNGQTRGEAALLTGFESAARLAYFLTGAPPDAELSEAAAGGPLDSDELEGQARRLLGSPSNRAVVRSFYADRLHLDPLSATPELGFTDQLAAAATEETARFVEDVVFDGAGTLRALLTEPSTWVNGPLAAFYGYPGITGEAFQKVSLDPQQRAGVLTQAAFLRATSHSQQTSPVMRGTRVLREILCSNLPAPPSGVAFPPIATPAGTTTRERLEASTSEAACSACHQIINPVGYAFEHYDAVGTWRDLENGLPIDSTGELRGSDAQGPFLDAPDLLHQIAEGEDAKACFARQWLSLALRREEASEDTCTKGEVTRSFLASDGNVVELLVALAKTDDFRYRLQAELTP